MEAKAETERLRHGQPRVPSGHSDGGQWTDGGGRSPARPSSAPKLPPMKPIKPLRAPSLPTRRPNGLFPPPLLPTRRPLQVEDWANLLEMREDMDFGNDKTKAIVLYVVHELAHPVLKYRLTPQSAQELIKKLKAF